jgi:hypothetical protein
MAGDRELAARAAHQHTAELLIRAVCNADISNRKGAVTLQQSPPSFFLFFFFPYVLPPPNKTKRNNQCTIPVYAKLDKLSDSFVG